MRPGAASARAAESGSAALPVSLLTGFLGSGKTTLLNRLLRGRARERICVVVNEFGELGIDGRLVIGARENVVELANGCLCCTVRGDLARTLGDLARRRGRRLGGVRFDRVIVEASGLASPGPAIQTFHAEPELARAYRLASVVCLVHAARAAEQLAAHPEAGEQVAYADLLLLNHCDEVDGEGRARARALLHACNAQAPVLECTRADVDLERCLAEPEGAPQERLAAARERSAERSIGGVHTCGVASVCLESERALDFDRLKLWLAFLAGRRSHELMRVKGVLRCAGHAGAVVVQGVYQSLEIGPGDPEPPERSALVLIGRDLDVAELGRGWLACQEGA